MGPKPPLKPDEVQAIKLRLRMGGNARDLAMFCLAIDSKLRASDLVSLTVHDITEFVTGGDVKIKGRAKVVQKKTQSEVAFEIGPETQACLKARIVETGKLDFDRLFGSLSGARRHLSTRQYERLVKDWVQLCGLNPMKYGTHSLRRTKVALLYKQT